MVAVVGNREMLRIRLRWNYDAGCFVLDEASAKLLILANAFLIDKGS